MKNETIQIKVKDLYEVCKKLMDEGKENSKVVIMPDGEDDEEYIYDDSIRFEKDSLYIDSSLDF